MLKQFWGSISYAGISRYDRSFNSQRQVIFNQLMFITIASAIIRLGVLGVSNAREFTPFSFIFNILPVILCILMFWLNTANHYRVSQYITFFMLPVAYWLVSFTQHDYSMAPFFAVFGILAFFFLESNTHLIISYLISTAGYLSLKLAEFHVDAGQSFVSELVLVMFNNTMVVVVLFMVLSFIRRVISSYQVQVADRTTELQNRNEALSGNHLEIMEKNALLEEKQASLTAANRHNNKVFSVISHDLRTPVVSVKNILDLHQKGKLSDEAMLDYLPELNREVGNVIDLLENLLHWARLGKNGETRNAEPVQVSALVQEMTTLYALAAGNKQIGFENNTTAGCQVLADRYMLKAIVRNLVSNAIKFTGHGGSIRFATVETEAGVAISITDNGRGMDAATIEQILGGGEFTTRGTAGEIGSGMGLSLCRDFVKRINGRLSISSTPGQGSTFTIMLPDALKASAQHAATTPGEQVLRVAKVA